MASYSGMPDNQMLWVTQVWVAGQILLNRSPRQGVAAVVLRMVGMALDLTESDVVAFFADGEQQQAPQILILHELFPGGFPTVAYPIVDPVLLKRIDHIR